jgi:hypothetical protein
VEQFDWKNKIVIKLSTYEMGKVMSFLQGTSPSVDVIHKTEHEGIPSTATLKMKKGSEGTFGIQVCSLLYFIIVFTFY